MGLIKYIMDKIITYEEALSTMQTEDEQYSKEGICRENRQARFIAEQALEQLINNDNTKKIISKSFDRAFKLADYINQNNIKKEDIQQIVYEPPLSLCPGGEYILFYWRTE